jgi:hypothetical protein
MSETTPPDELTAFRRWHWRTWNLLLQIRDATDGNDPRQRSGEMTGRALCSARGPAILALARRGWIESLGCEEVEDEDTGRMRFWPAWAITKKGREALAAAKQLGVEMR